MQTKFLDIKTPSISFGAEDNHTTSSLSLSINNSLFSKVGYCSPLFFCFVLVSISFSVETLLMLEVKWQRVSSSLEGEKCGKLYPKAGFHDWLTRNNWNNKTTARSACHLLFTWISAENEEIKWMELRKVESILEHCSWNYFKWNSSNVN